MTSENAKKIIYLNASVTLLSQFVQVLLGFAIRKFFVDKLGVEYLGYNSVFSNILQMLNLADLGIGVAITSFLYKPIINKDEQRINALMYIYKRVYHVMGLLVSGVGIIVLIIIPVIIPDAQCSDSYLRLLFTINLIGTISTYFLAYKRTLLIAEQKSYLVMAIDTIFYILCSLLQIIVLFCIPNYLVYLFLNVFKNVISNIVLVFVCNKNNEFLSKENIDKNVVDEYKKPILNYVKDLFVSRIGGFVYYGTDNIIISVFKGSLLVGFLSNYTMVTNLVNNLIIQVLSSLQATYGQYISSEEDIKKQKQMTDNYIFINYLVGNFCMNCILFLIQPFVEMYFGMHYVLSNEIVILLSVNFLLTIMMQIPSQVFVVYKLYHYDYPVVIVSAILNIIISISLVIKLGIAGVLLGTLVTSLVYLFSRYFIISRYVFKCSYWKYLIKIGRYFLITIITLVIEYVASSRFGLNSWPLFIIKGMLVGLISILVPFILSLRIEEIDFVRNEILLMKIKKRNVLLYILILMVLMVGALILVGQNLDNSGYKVAYGNKPLF